MAFTERNWDWRSATSEQTCDRVDLPWRDILQQDYDLDMTLVGAADLQVEMTLIRFYFAPYKWLQCGEIAVIGNSTPKSIKNTCSLMAQF